MAKPHLPPSLNKLIFRPKSNGPDQQRPLDLTPVKRLHDYMQGLVAKIDDYKLLRLNLSKLESHNRSESDIRVAIDAFKNYIAHCGGEVFWLPNHDIIYIYNSERDDDVLAAARKLRGLFRDDPLTEKSENITGGFYEHTTLKQGFDALLGHLNDLLFGNNLTTIRRADLPKTKMGKGKNENSKSFGKKLTPPSEIAARQKESDAGQSGLDAPIFKGFRQTIAPDDLAKICDVLRQADIEAFLTKQPICTLLSPQAVPHSLFDKWAFDYDALAARLLPTHNFTENFWLFRYLDDFLKNKLCAFLVKHANMLPENNFCLHLSWQVLRGENFSDLARLIRRRSSLPLIVVLDYEETIYSPDRMMRAQRLAAQEGFKLAIGNLPPAFLLQDAANLPKADLYFIHAPHLLATKQLLKAAPAKPPLHKSDKSRFILSHATDMECLEMGHEWGFLMYEGPIFKAKA